MKYLLSIVACAAFAFSASSQDTYNDKIQQYIDKYKDVAMAEMQRTGVPASITLSQGILESSCGFSDLATKGNNHFGIKCHDGWEGKSMTFDDDARDECFRCYESVEQSFKDHSDFLRTRQRYAFLFEYSPTDYKKWAHGLKQAGYATNPKYPELLINNIEKYNLNQYDIYDSFVADNSGSIKSTERQKEHKSFLNGLTTSKPHTSQASGSRIMFINDLKAVRLLQDETLEQVGNRYDVSTSRILKYNDLNVIEKLPAGTLIYLQPKRRQGDSLYHVVKSTETMYSISQQHGMRLQYLYVKNNMDPGTQPAVGEVVYLRDQRSTKPVLRGNEPKKPTPELSSSIASIDSKSINATPSEDASPKYAKPMPTDELFPPANNNKINASMNIQEQNNPAPIDVAPPSARDSSTEIENSAQYISSAETEGVDYYTVKPKDTLYSIARSSGLTVDKLMEINKLGSNVISSGMRLRIKP